MSKEWLIMTSQKEYWPSSVNTVMLGEWCKVGGNKILDSSEMKGVPYHWDDREKFEKDYKKCKNLYYKYSSILYKNLNIMHGVELSEKYWNILMGRWLKTFIEVAYDRYECILAAEKYNRNMCVQIRQPENLFHLDHPSFTAHEYNFYIFSEIIKHRGKFDITLSNISNKPFKNNYSYIQKKDSLLTQFRSLFFKHIIQKPLHIFINQTLGVLFHKISGAILRMAPQKIIFIGTIYLSKVDFLKLSLKLRTIPVLFHGTKVPISKDSISEELRTSILFPTTDNDFEKFLQKMLPYEIPSTYIENFSGIRNFVLKSNASNIKMLVIKANIGQIEAKTTFPTVASISTENFTQVAGKNMKAVARAVVNSSK